MFADIIDAKTVVEHNMHVRHPDSLAQGYWGQGRVTLVGDAAHPLRPASGMLAIHQESIWYTSLSGSLRLAPLCCWH